MPNQTLISRIEVVLKSVRERQCSAGTLAAIIRLNGRGLEAMPYALIREMESLAMDLDIAQWYDEDGFLPELGKVLERTEDWLAELPQGV